MNIISILLICLILPSVSFSADYYVCGNGTTCGAGWSTGNNSNACTSKGAPCLTILGGIGKMSGGDTLTIGDGTYQGTANMIASSSGTQPVSPFPSGSAGAYTTIKAENYQGVTIDGQGLYRPAYLDNRSYTIFDGIAFVNSIGTNFDAVSASHLKILRCSFSEGNDFGLRFADYSTYNLAEDCFSYGKGSYHFVVYGGQSHYNIFRRCVVRQGALHRPAAGGGNHWSAFAAYTSTDTYFQNCIAIDGLYQFLGDEGDESTFTKAQFYGANPPSTGYNAYLIGCIFLNNQGRSIRVESGGSPFSATNCFFRQSQTDPGGWLNSLQLTGSANTLENIVSSGVNRSGISSIYQYGSFSSFANNIVYDNYYGLSGTFTSSYTYLYDNTGANYNGTTPGTGDSTATNPLTSGLTYPVRIETASTLKTAGSGGGQVGPTILKRVGASETLYGDTGWNTVTETDLWPWPNEATIKAKFAAYNKNGETGARGFATGTSLDGSAQTLTKYIWEYLGNQIPADIYGSTTAPTLSALSPSGTQSCTSDPRNVTESLTTSEAATCRAHDTATTWAGMTEMSTTGGTSHSRTVSRACGVAYSPNVICRDAAANESAMSEWAYQVGNISVKLRGGHITKAP